MSGYIITDHAWISQTAAIYLYWATCMLLKDQTAMHGMHMVFTSDSNLTHQTSPNCKTAGIYMYGD